MTEPCPLCGFEHEVVLWYGFKLVVCPGALEGSVIVVPESFPERAGDG